MTIKSQAAIDAATFAAKVSGFGSFGLMVEHWTGYPGVFWVAAAAGAVFIRRPVEGREGARLTLRGIAVGLVWSWLLTEATLDMAGWPREIYLIPVAGFWAAFGELIGKIITDPVRLRSFLLIIRGRS